MPRSTREPLPWTRFNYDDFLDDPVVAMMGDDMIGPYLRLLRAAWNAERFGWRPGYLKADPLYLAATSRLLGDRWQGHWEALARAFDTESEPGWWIQKRIVREYEVGRRIARRNIARAEAAAAARYVLRACPEQPTKQPEVRGKRLETRENLESTPLAQSPASPARAPVFTLKATNGEHQVTEADCEAWRRACPGVDLMRELHAMAAWMDANPTKRKTVRGMPRFAFSWLQRAQNRPRGDPLPNANGTAKPPPDLWQQHRERMEAT